MNKTQDQFNPKPKENLLEENAEKGSPNLLTAEAKREGQEETPASPERAETAEAEKSNKKKYSMVTDAQDARKPETGIPSPSKEAEKIPSGPEKKELSVTTQNPSHLGNLRDPRYSQEMQQNQHYKKKGKRRQVIQSGANGKGLIKEEGDPMNGPEPSAAQKTHVHLPKVQRTDESEVADESLRDPSTSPEPRDNSLPKGSPKNMTMNQKQIRIAKLGSPQEFTIDSDDHPTAGRGLDLLRGPLPYDEVTNTAFSGMRGSKRN